jgi:hypothetical protein
MDGLLFTFSLFLYPVEYLLIHISDNVSNSCESKMVAGHNSDKGAMHTIGSQFLAGSL